MQNKTQALALIGLLLSLALSGCATSDPDPEDKQVLGDDGLAVDGNQTVNLTAVIRILFDGNETAAINGSIPAAVGANLTFDATSSIGENLSYAWDFGDNATATEAVAVHAYAAPGSYNVTLVVSLGNNTSNASTVIDVASAGPAPGTLAGTDTKTFTGSLTLGNPNAPTTAGTDYRDHVVAIADVAPDGTPATAKKVRISLDSSGAGVIHMMLYWRSPAGSNLASSAGIAGPTITQDVNLNYDGDMPAGNYVVRVRMQVGAQATYTVKANVDYFAT